MRKLRKETNDTTIKDVRNLFRLEKENEAIRDRIVRDIRNLFEYGERNYYKLAIVGNFWSNNYVEYESKGNKNNQLKNIFIKLDHT